MAQMRSAMAASGGAATLGNPTRGITPQFALRVAARRAHWLASSSHDGSSV